MRLVTAMALVVGAAVPAFAQDAVPDLKGVWTSDFDFIILGNNVHHPGGQTTSDPARTGTISFTLDIEGQDGRKAWGKSWSNPDVKEPLALVIAPDNRTAMGADTDGIVNITVLGPDSIQVCYAHAGTSATKSIVAACGTSSRQK